MFTKILVCTESTEDSYSDFELQKRLKEFVENDEEVSFKTSNLDLAFYIFMKEVLSKKIPLSKVRVKTLDGVFVGINSETLDLKQEVVEADFYYNQIKTLEPLFEIDEISFNLDEQKPLKTLVLSNVSEFSKSNSDLLKSIQNFLLDDSMEFTTSNITVGVQVFFTQAFLLNYPQNKLKIKLLNNEVASVTNDYYYDAKDSAVEFIPDLVTELSMLL